MWCITMSLMTVQESMLGPGNCRLERSEPLCRPMLLLMTALSKSYLVCCKQVFISTAQEDSFQVQNLLVSQRHRSEVQLHMHYWNTELCICCVYLLALKSVIHLPLARCWASPLTPSPLSPILPLRNTVHLTLCSYESSCFLRTKEAFANEQS